MAVQLTDILFMFESQDSEPKISSGEESEDEGQLVDWRCIACNKTFRSERAFTNHERCLAFQPSHQLTRCIIRCLKHMHGAISPVEEEEVDATHSSHPPCSGPIASPAAHGFNDSGRGQGCSCMTSLPVLE